MLYREPKMEVLELKKENLILTSYHDENKPGDDYSDVSGDDKWA